MPRLQDQNANQVHVKEEDSDEAGKTLDGCKEQASDVRMQHEASICICMVLESANIFWHHARVVKQVFGVRYSCDSSCPEKAG